MQPAVGIANIYHTFLLARLHNQIIDFQEPPWHSNARYPSLNPTAN